MEELNSVLQKTNDKNQEKVDWTKVWSKKYPILKKYSDEVDVSKYATILNSLLKQLQDDYGYSEVEAMLVLKDILYKEYKNE